MATPFTNGKDGSNKSGGHTSQGHNIPAGGKQASTAASNTRVGTLKKRTKGMSGSDYPA